MGYAIAAQLASRGARVTLVSGKTNLDAPQGVSRIDVTTAQEMLEATTKLFSECDGAIMCAAVADYTPSEISPTKLKKKSLELSITLKQTKDIAAEIGAIKGDKLLIGFALETDNEIANATSKLERKNLDMIVLNSLQDIGAGFGHDTNKVTIISRNGDISPYPLTSKSKIADIIAARIENHFHKSL